MQLPTTLGPNSEPEPNVAVVQINYKEYSDRHPSAAEVFCFIGVADSTLLSDRNQKALTYARAGIAEYWVLDVNQRQIYILRGSNSEQYIQELVLNDNASFSPLAFPDIRIQVSQLFPPTI